MKKIGALFAIPLILVLVAFGRQATTVKPAQTPAPPKPARAATLKPAIAPIKQSKDGAIGITTTVWSAQTRVTPAQRVTPSVAQEVAPAVAPATPRPQAEAAPGATPLASGVAAQPLTETMNPQPRLAATRPATATIAQQATTPAPAAQGAKEPDYVSEKGFKGRVFEVKYRDPLSLVRAVSGLGSGFKGAEIRANDDFKTITVRDFPENIVAIEEALKRLDSPQSPRPDIEIRIHVLIGSATAGQWEEVPADLARVLSELQSTLRYKNYSLMFSALHRTKEGGQGVSNNGVAESKMFNAVVVPAGNQIFYEYLISQISLDSSTSAGTTIQVGNFQFQLRIPLVLGTASDPKINYQNVGFRSPVSLREGEKVVVGTTTMGDKGLIVVLTAKVTK